MTLEVGEIDNADALGNEPIYDKAGAMVGRATAGGFGWRLGKSLALGYVQPEHAALGTDLEIDILGKMHPCTIIEESPFDPENARLRA